MTCYRRVALVDLLGGFIIGAALAYFLCHPGLDPAWRLLGCSAE